LNRAQKTFSVVLTASGCRPNTYDASFLGMMGTK
jgi:hypothetical protein